MKVARVPVPAPRFSGEVIQLTRQRHSRRRFLWWIGVLGVFPLVLAVASGYTLVRARHQLNAGVAELRLAEAQLTPAKIRRAPLASLDSARGRIAQAHANFKDATGTLSALAPVLQRLGWVPAIGDKLSAAPEIGATAEEATAGAMEILDGVGPIAGQFVGRRGASHPGLSYVMRELALQQPRFNRACRLLTEARASRRQIPDSNDATIRAALQSFDRQLPSLTTACKSIQLVPGILGFGQPRAYLVAYQDKLELRATGGFIGSLGLLHVTRGHVRQQFAGADFISGKQGIGATENFSYASPMPIHLYNYEPSWLFRDSNWSPDFPTTAQLEAFFFRRDTGRTVDGVIDMTADGTADLLRATGPISIPEYGRTVSASTVASLADYYAHFAELRVAPGSGPNFGPQTAGDFDTRRKQFIGIVGRHVLEAVMNPTIDTLLRLSTSLSDAFARRDILIYQVDPRAEALVRRIKAGGEINPTKSDYLYVVDTNIGYTKNNEFVHLSTSDHVRIRPDRWLDTRLTIRLHNNPAPTSYQRLGWWGPGGGSLGGWDDYATFIRVFVPLGAQLIDQSGWTQPWTGGTAYGKTMFCGYLIVRRGRSATIRLHYVVPPNVFSWSRGKRYRLVVQHQPGTFPDRVTASFSGEGIRTRSVTIIGPQTDWRTTFSVPTKPFRAIPLPAVPATVVAPGHWIEPYAYLGPRP